MSYQKYICLLCGFVYDEEQGWPQDGIEPGTRWDAVPEDWQCPDCGAMKEDFQMVVIQ
ncbi:MAG: rubredoxin [Gammaproteobacteria bacterium CG_4_10_14_0_8_um_filter_38_16]|nr:MAG: rubredoxin [Gammaproteobacteria bacterium CG_4_10_14_0_8_um_filter_38_16]PJA03865.1 MAG: rubredoxin [Gammaproteobacteria bacterium CG_4_10_14_0_2_um_filter_38_22]PJB10849.1 MAG: rubredoxin [Gammaproteobacteria bacterium CG_4_9_14_3_um_filter_38_9]